MPSDPDSRSDPEVSALAPPKDAAPERRAALVVNTRSRQGRDLHAQARTLLEARGFVVDESFPVSRPDVLLGLVRRLVNRGRGLVVVGGGDGTVSESVDAFAYRESVLGYLPLGTTNNFARSLGIPLDVEGAVDVIAAGRVEEVDLGRIHDDYFANVCSLGLTVQTALSVSPRQKRYLGRVAYGLAGLRSLHRQQAFTLDVTADGERHRFVTRQAIVANGRFHAGRVLSEDSGVDTARLLIYVMEGGSAWQVVKGHAAYLAGWGERLRQTTELSAREVQLVAHPAQAIEVDGEVNAATPTRVAVAPGALRVMVPIDVGPPGV